MKKYGTVIFFDEECIYDILKPLLNFWMDARTLLQMDSCWVLSMLEKVGKKT